MVTSDRLTYNMLLKRLNAVRKKEKIFSLLKGFCNVSSFISIVLVLFSVINLIMKLNTSGRLASVITILLVSSILVTYFILRPIFRLVIRKSVPSFYSVAEMVGKSFPGIKDRLLNALQLHRFYTLNKEGYSLALVDQALNEAHDESKDKDFLTIIDSKPVFRAFRNFIIAFIVLGAIAVPVKEKFVNSARQLLHPLTSFEEAPRYRLTVEPGDVEVIKNDNVIIKITGEGDIPQTISLHLRNALNNYETSHVISSDQFKTYSYTIENIKDSTEYYGFSNSVRTPTYKISVIELPMVRSVQIKLDYPEYSRIESKFLDENVGDITALKGTVASFYIQSNKSLQESRLIFQDGKDHRLSVQGVTAKGNLQILSDNEYYVLITDKSGRANVDPIKYRIHIIEDNYPTVRINVPGKDVDITEEMILLLSIEAEDDFGFSDVKLAYQVQKAGSPTDSTRQYLQLPVDNYHSEKISINYTWNLTELNLFPEDAVTYYVEVADNDRISGPKKAKSLTYLVRFPSINEIYAEVQKEHELAFDSFEGMYEQSKELKEKLSELVQEMKKDPNLNWEEKKQLEDVVKTQQQMQQSLAEVEQQLDEMIERMEKNDLTSIETLKKYIELQNLLQEIMTDELKEAIKKLQKSMENVNPEELKQAVEELDINQEDFLKRIEKTLSLLKRLQIEQQLDEVIKKTEELLKDQNELLDKAEQASKDDAKNLAKDQKGIQQHTEALQQQIENLNERMTEFPEMPRSQVEAALNMMDQEKLVENMNQASENFQKGDMSNGQQHSQMAQNTLSELNDMLTTARQELLNAQKQQIMSEMKHISSDLLRLSMKQEDVLKSTKELDKTSPKMEDVADRQQDLINGMARVTDRAGELSNKTFFMSSQIMQLMGRSLSSMQESINRMEERNTSMVTRNQGNAMTSLNEAVQQIRSAMKQLASAESASGMDEMMNQLAQMSQKQQGINQQTMQLGMGQLTLQQQAMMARMAAEQAALKKSLEQLAREFGERSDVLGRLDQIANDMDEVVNDLQSKNANRKTINRQRQILSRLLDAQKSVQRREYSRKRKAETGKHYIASSPGELPFNLGEQDYKLRQDLLKALKEGYSRDYQELIKKYFEALVNEHQNN